MLGGKGLKRIFRITTFIVFLVTILFMVWLYKSWQDDREMKKKGTVYNAYILQIDSTSLVAFTDGKRVKYTLDGKLDPSLIGSIADLEIEDGFLVKISTKPDSIKGKILEVDENELELEHYGDIKFDPNVKIYRVEGEVAQGTRNDIIVGYSNAKFIVANMKISAVLIEKETKVENIRVILKTDNFASYEHKNVILTATEDFAIAYGDKTENHKKGERVTIKQDSNQLEKGRCKISAENEGEIQLLSIKRQNRNPMYRGSLEIIKKKEGLRIVNELPLEWYLYGVVPSEMSRDSGGEALKVQAICARSYGYQQILENKMRKYSAHVDDSVAFQVYNNCQEDKMTTDAVNATKGKVVMYGDKIATTYFFSTSCGATSSAKDVWFTNKEIPYLQSQWQKEGGGSTDLNNENKFKEFITSNETTYDSASPWYRWQANISSGNIKKSLEKSIQDRYEVNNTHIKVKEKNGSFSSRKIKTIGDIKAIRIVSRKSGGIVTAIEVEGSKETILIFSEYNIRLLLSGENTTIVRKDGSEVNGLQLLPSSFFIVQKKGNQFVFQGGGFGHGVGMSQVGAKAMAGQGKKYDEIISHFFPKTTLQSIYQSVDS